VGVVIRAIGTSTGASAHGSVQHAAVAARDCLARAGVAGGDVDVLINTGVFRDDNLCEPALAVFIQAELGINLDYAVSASAKPTLSFDLSNGACGPLNAVQAAQAFLAPPGGAQHVLVVAADAHPSGRTDRVPGFPYATGGAAMLLAHDPDPRAGFGAVRTTLATRTAPDRSGYYDPTDPDDRLTVVVPELSEDGFAQWVDLAGELVDRHAEAEGLDLTRSLFLTSGSPVHLATALSYRLGVAADAVITPTGDGEPHTAAVMLAYRHTVEARYTDRYRQLVFVTVGSGPTGACVTYQIASS
jgi:3-oxoacyl-[acyl-carrier-protein] synthase-3